MSTGNLDNAFDYTPEVSDKEINSALKNAEPAEGVYLVRSLGGTKQISKAEKPKSTGKAMVMEEFQFLRPSDKAVSAYTCKKWHILPIAPRAQWLAAVGYEGWDADSGTVIPGSRIANLLANFDADGKNKMWLNRWRSRLRAGFGSDAYPNYPKAVDGSSYTQFTLPDGTVVDKEGSESAKGEMIRSIKLAAHAAIKDGGILKGQEFYIDLYFQTDKAGKRTSDLPAIDWFYSLDYPPKDEKTGAVKEVLDPFVSVK